MATLQDVIDEARVILQDTAKVRYTDAELTKSCNYALFEAYRLRPDLFFAATWADPTVKLISDPFPLPPMIEPLVSDYIAARAELRDDEYSDDGRAAALMIMFKQSLMGGA